MAIKLVKSDGDLGPQTAERKPRRVGVIDIGSNSIRLVVFEGAPRAPFAIFNEKVLCGVGQRLQSTGKLDPDGVAAALDNLPRFVAAATAMEVEQLHTVATAAVRDALDGQSFVDAIEKRCGVTVKTIPGDEEARLSALGVIAGCPEADGIVGDLGGGSLELIVVAKGAVSQHATLPLGALRLHELAAGGADIRDVINGHLAMLPWLESAKAKNFYAVGGAWRSLARIHMAQSEYRLRVIDNYAVDADEFREFAKVISQQRATTLSKFPDLPARRASTLPIASLILRRVLARIAPRRLVFSAHGLREGIVFDALSAAEQKRDPLLDATIEFSRQFARFSGFSDALVRWTAGLYGDEPVEDARLRRAMCYLSDIGWSEHPDYRARHAFERVLTLPVMGLDHPARAFLAHAIHARYGGDDDEIGRKFGRRIGLDEAREDRARALGLALRLGYTVSAGQESLLNATSLARQGQSVVLTVPARGAAAFVGEAVERRLKDLAEQLNLKPRIDGGGR